MKQFRGILALLSTSVLCLGQAAHAPAQKPRTITMKIVNGKSGKPVKGELVNLFLGSGKDARRSYPRADSNGEITITIGDNEKGPLRYMPGDSRDCRYEKLSIQGGHLEMAIDEILSKGIVTENFCGKAHADPAPGIVVVFVRAYTLAERWQL